MNTVEIFTNETLGSVRVMKDQRGEWFVAKDICDILELTDVSKSCSRLDYDEKGTNSIRTPGGNQEMLCVNEYGLWQLVLGSRKSQAKEFKRWLTHEVIPAIRQNGGYIDGQEFLPVEERTKFEAEIKELHAMVKDYQYQNARFKEKVDHLARIIESDTTGDFDKKKNKSWAEADIYDLDVEGFDEFQSEMELFNFSDYSLMEEMKAIINSAKSHYIDRSAANYLIGEMTRLFVERNTR